MTSQFSTLLKGITHDCVMPSKQKNHVEHDEIAQGDEPVFFTDERNHT